MIFNAGSGLCTSRPLRGGVDRNDAKVRIDTEAERVAPFAGAWIETTDPSAHPACW